MMEQDNINRRILESPNKNKNEDNFLQSLPYPFSLMDLRKSKSSTGKCWLFHMSSKGVMHGFLFPGGYR